MSRQFNVSAYPVLAKDYPHVFEKLQIFWGYPEFNQYIDTLCLQDRDTARAGFSREALAEIHFASELHELVVPSPEPTCVWAQQVMIP